MELAFSALRQQHPNVAIHLTTAGTGELFRLLDHNEVDLVCTLDTHIYNNSYVIAAEEPVGLHFVVAADHPLAKKEQLSKEDLLREDFLLTERGMSYRRLLDDWMAKASLQIQPVLETGSADLICRLVERGVGISLLPDYVTEASVRQGRLVRRDAENFRPELWVQLLYHKNKWLSRPMQAVIQHLSEISLPG
jgi:DNA-binding transcriptional LysR family regulator